MTVVPLLRRTRRWEHQCPKCGKLIQWALLYCAHCGKRGQNPPWEKGQ